MCVTIIPSSGKFEMGGGQVEPQTDTPPRRKQELFSEGSRRRGRLLDSPQASNKPSSIRRDKEDSTISERIGDSAPPLFASIKTTCQPRREGLQDSSPFNIDEQAVEPGTTEYISSLSDTPSSLRHLRRGNDGHFLSVHAETSRLFDFNYDTDDSDEDDDY